MDERKNSIKESNCNVSLENRHKLCVTGVTDVDTFDEDGIILITTMGMLTVNGSELHISKFNVESGELMVEGDIDRLEFKNGGGKQTGSILAKMFK